MIYSTCFFLSVKATSQCVTWSQPEVFIRYISGLAFTLWRSVVRLPFCVETLHIKHICVLTLHLTCSNNNTRFTYTDRFILEFNHWCNEIPLQHLTCLRAYKNMLGTSTLDVDHVCQVSFLSAKNLKQHRKFSPQIFWQRRTKLLVLYTTFNLHLCVGVAGRGGGGGRLVG